MSVADWVILAFIFLSMVTAASQGFFFELFSLAGVVVGYIVAVWEYYRLAAWFQPYVKAQWVSDLLGFLLVFVAIVALASILGKIVRKLVKSNEETLAATADATQKAQLAAENAILASLGMYGLFASPETIAQVL